MTTMLVATSSATPSIGWLSRSRSSTSAHISSMTTPITTEPAALSPSTSQPNKLLGAAGTAARIQVRDFRQTSSAATTQRNAWTGMPGTALP